MIERLIFPRESWLKMIRSFYVCMNEFFFFLNMTCDLRTELNVIPESFRFAWGIGDSSPSVLVSLPGCSNAFFFSFFSCET